MTTTTENINLTLKDFKKKIDYLLSIAEGKVKSHDTDLSDILKRIKIIENKIPTDDEAKNLKYLISSMTKMDRYISKLQIPDRSIIIPDTIIPLTNPTMYTNFYNNVYKYNVLEQFLRFGNIWLMIDIKNNFLTNYMVIKCTNRVEIVIKRIDDSLYNIKLISNKIDLGEIEINPIVYFSEDEVIPNERPTYINICLNLLNYSVQCTQLQVNLDTLSEEIVLHEIGILDVLCVIEVLPINCAVFLEPSTQNETILPLIYFKAITDLRQNGLLSLVNYFGADGMTPPGLAGLGGVTALKFMFPYLDSTVKVSEITYINDRDIVMTDLRPYHNGKIIQISETEDTIITSYDRTWAGVSRDERPLVSCLHLYGLPYPRPQTELIKTLLLPQMEAILPLKLGTKRIDRAITYIGLDNRLNHEFEIEVDFYDGPVKLKCWLELGIQSEGVFDIEPDIDKFVDLAKNPLTLSGVTIKNRLKPDDPEKQFNIANAWIGFAVPAGRIGSLVEDCRVKIFKQASLYCRLIILNQMATALAEVVGEFNINLNIGGNNVSFRTLSLSTITKEDGTQIPVFMTESIVIPDVVLYQTMFSLEDSENVKPDRVEYQTEEGTTVYMNRQHQGANMTITLHDAGSGIKEQLGFNPGGCTLNTETRSLDFNEISWYGRGTDIITNDRARDEYSFGSGFLTFYPLKNTMEFDDRYNGDKSTVKKITNVPSKPGWNYLYIDHSFMKGAVNFQDISSDVGETRYIVGISGTKKKIDPWPVSSDLCAKNVDYKVVHSSKEYIKLNNNWYFAESNDNPVSVDFPSMSASIYEEPIFNKEPELFSDTVYAAEVSGYLNRNFYNNDMIVQFNYGERDGYINLETNLPITINKFIFTLRQTVVPGGSWLPNVLDPTLQELITAVSTISILLMEERYYGKIRDEQIELMHDRISELEKQMSDLITELNKIFTPPETTWMDKVLGVGSMIAQGLAPIFRILGPVMDVTLSVLSGVNTISKGDTLTGMIEILSAGIISAGVGWKNLRNKISDRLIMNDGEKIKLESKDWTPKFKEEVKTTVGIKTSISPKSSLRNNHLTGGYIIYNKEIKKAELKTWTVVGEGPGTVSDGKMYFTNTTSTSSNLFASDIQYCYLQRSVDPKSEYKLSSFDNTGVYVGCTDVVKNISKEEFLLGLNISNEHWKIFEVYYKGLQTYSSVATIDRDLLLMLPLDYVNYQPYQNKRIVSEKRAILVKSVRDNKIERMVRQEYLLEKLFYRNTVLDVFDAQDDSYNKMIYAGRVSSYKDETSPF